MKLIIVKIISLDLIIIYLENVHFFHDTIGLDIVTFAHMRSLHTFLNTAHSGYRPSTSMSIHTLFLSLPISLLTGLTSCLCHLASFYRLIPNHPHSYLHPDAQTTSICHASPHLPHSAHPVDCTNPHCASYLPATPLTSISPSSFPSYPDFADLFSSWPRFQSHSTN